MPENEKDELYNEFEDEDEPTSLFDYITVLFDYLIILAKRKKLILLITLPVTIISIIITLQSSVSFYSAQTSIFLAKQKKQSTVNQFMSQLGVFSGGSNKNVYNNRSLFVEIIKSRTFTTIMIDRFKIRETYGLDYVKAKKLFLSKITIRPDFTDPLQSNAYKNYNSPLMRIIARDENPKRAAEIVNAIVEELNAFVNRLAISDASQRRLFIEGQLKQASNDLITAEENLKTFQEKTGIFKVEDQTAMIIQEIANLKAKITLNEINLKVMESYSTAHNPEFQRIKDTIAALKNELSKHETNMRIGRDSMITVANIPELELEFKRVYRQLKYQETLYGVMLNQYEAAKLDEAKEATLIQVIDKAIPSTKIDSTRKWGWKNTLLIMMIAFVFSCFFVLVKEYFKETPTELNAKLEDFKQHLSYKKHT